MKVSIVYDNDAWKEGLRAHWGFSCLVEVYGRTILFDTGANGSILLGNMKELNINPLSVEEIVISHAHFDHTGGLPDFLRLNPVNVYLPLSCHLRRGVPGFIMVKEPVEIHEHIYSTGELRGIEQSLVIKIEKGLVVIVGCSHPGVENILEAASEFGRPWGIIGGLHGFSDFDLIRDLELVCPLHCTQFKSRIRSLYPEKYIQGGAGKVIEIQ